MMNPLSLLIISSKARSASRFLPPVVSAMDVLVCVWEGEGREGKRGKGSAVCLAHHFVCVLAVGTVVSRVFVALSRWYGLPLGWRSNGAAGWRVGVSDAHGVCVCVACSDK